MVVIKNGRVMDPKTGLDQVCDLRIEGKKIVEIAENLSDVDRQNSWSPSQPYECGDFPWLQKLRLPLR